MTTQTIQFDPAPFLRDGYFNVKGVFTPEECLGLKKTLLEEIEKGKKELEEELKSGPQTDYDRGKVADTPRGILKGMLQDIAHRSPYFLKIAKDERILACIKPLLGEKLVLYRSLSVFKPKEYKQPVGWHQDMAYWKGTRDKISVWVSLDDVDKATGAMQFVPGTQGELVNETEIQNEVFSIVLKDKHVDSAKSAVAETKRGDMVLFDSCVIHGSGANETGKDRFTLIYTYQPASDQSHHRNGPPEVIC